MSHSIKHVIFVFICSCLTIPHHTYSQDTNEASEPAVEGPDVIDLLEGGTLDAWKVPSASWYIEDGYIVGYTGEEKLETPEWLYTKQQFSDFEFTCELKLTGDNHRNTGIYYRVKTFLFESSRGNKSYEAPSGYEFDAAYHIPGKRNNRGSLGDWYARPSLRILPDQNIINQVYQSEKWNRMTLRVRGNRLEYWINGIKVMDYVDNDPKASRNGFIGFQIHDGSVMKVEYRNIRVLPIQPVRNDKVFTEYEIKEFSFKGHDAKIVFPHKQNPNNYWIWRARFWGHEPQVDKALLEKGFQLAHIDVSDLYGNNEAVELWNDFYNFCISEYGFNRKVVLEGMSRGGLIVYNWASKNTDKVFCIYADAPVCDIKSWPGGMFNGKGNPDAWQVCLKAYNLDTLTVKTFYDIPINNSVKLAKAGIPVIHVFGDADVVVPYKENTALLAEKFKEAGGAIELISKKGVGHHPHCLEDPKPIVDFILKSVE